MKMVKQQLNAKASVKWISISKMAKHEPNTKALINVKASVKL
jgi:hypothetical protein